MVNRIIALSLLAVLLVAAASPAAAQSGLSDGIVACWTMDEPNGPRADSVGYRHLTDVNTVGQAGGVIGNSAYIVAANSEYLTRLISGDAAMTPTNWTISSWFYFDGVGTLNYQWLFPGVAYSRWASATGKVRLFVPGGVYIDSTQSLSANKWYLVTTWLDDSNNTIGVQINDNPPATTTYTGSMASSAEFVWGGGGSMLTGRIDNGAFWNRILTADEIDDYYNAGNGVSCDDVLDDGGGGGGTVIAGPLGSTYDVDLPSGGTGVIEMYSTAGDLFTAGSILALVTLTLFRVLQGMTARSKVK